MSAGKEKAFSFSERAPLLFFTPPPHRRMDIQVDEGCVADKKNRITNNPPSHVCTKPTNSPPFIRFSFSCLGSAGNRGQKLGVKLGSAARHDAPFYVEKTTRRKVQFFAGAIRDDSPSLGHHRRTRRVIPDLLAVLDAGFPKEHESSSRR